MQRSASQRLIESEEKFGKVFQRSPYILTISRFEDGVILDVNEKFVKELGYARDEVIGKSTVELGLYANDDRAELVSQILDNGYASDVETQFRTSDGDIIDARANCEIIAVNGTQRLLIAAENITASKQAEAERLKLEAQLRQTQKLEAIGTLAGGIAHDFNNILFAVIGYADIALETLEPDNAARTYLEEILVAGNRASALVRQILSFSRKTDIHRTNISLDPIITEALKLLRSTTPTTITINQNCEETSGKVIADPTEIHQLLMNLCTNSIHAMLDQGGVLDVSLKEFTVDTEFAQVHSGLTAGPYLLLSVANTGTGIPPDILDHVFDPFFTTKGTGEGTGLGLSVVHGIVTQMGGVIKAYSSPGAGTVFSIYLPQSQASSKQQDDAELLSEFEGRGEILLVDDEPAILQIVGQMLTHLGFHVTPHSSSSAALVDFKQAPQKYDLVVTDLAMPKLTGMDLAQEILKLRPELPIILCTGFAHNLTEIAARKQGISEFLLKPISKSQFARAISRVLEH